MENTRKFALRAALLVRVYSEFIWNELKLACLSCLYQRYIYVDRRHEQFITMLCDQIERKILAVSTGRKKKAALPYFEVCFSYWCDKKRVGGISDLHALVVTCLTCVLDGYGM